MFASASVTPCSSAHIVGARPGEADDAFRTRSGSARSSSSVGSPPTCVSGASPSIGVEPEVAGDELEVGVRVDHLDRLAPDRAGRAEQGDPRHPDSVPTPVCPVRTQVPDGGHEVRRRRGGEEQRVDPVEHAAVAAEQRARVLHAHVALEHRLEEVADRRGDREHHAEDDRLRRSSGSPACRARRRRRRSSPPCRTTNPSHVLPGEVLRRHLVPAEQPPADVGERVAGPDREQHGERRQPPVVRAARAAASGTRARRRSRPRPSRCR